MESNNCFVRHPTLGERVLVPFGMFIQPRTRQIGDLRISGFEVVTEEEGGLADQATLLVGDLLVAIGGIFIDDKTLEAVQALFKLQSPKFSMTLIRQVKAATGDSPKYASLKITIELGVGETDDVIVTFNSTERKVLFVYRRPLSSRQFAQLFGVTRYMKATSSTTVSMQTWTSFPSGPYDWDLNIYQQVTGDATAVTFFNEQYEGTILGPKSESPVKLEQGVKSPTPGQIVEPTDNFFYMKPTGSQQFAFESVLIKGNYLTSEGTPLKLITQTARPSHLPKESRFLMTKQRRNVDGSEQPTHPGCERV